MTLAHDDLLNVAARFGAQGALDPRTLLGQTQLFDRSDVLNLASPTRTAPGGATRLLEAKDGWIAATLGRACDWASVAAWLEDSLLLDIEPGTSASWECIAHRVRLKRGALLCARALDLGIAVSRVGETRAQDPRALIHRLGAPLTATGERRQVVDLSALWAGPLCGAILANRGHEVIKVEAPERPDPTRMLAPLDARLNGRKTRVSMPFDLRPGSPLRRLLDEADVVISSARPRVFDQAGMTPARLAASRSGFIWVAITGHGWHGAGRDRVGFGDDCAAAGGLLVRDAADAPLFAGDALADPLTGLMAGVAAIEQIEAGGGVLIDAALARTAAGFATCLERARRRFA